jgi:phospholipid/cholesterol/gamma-HCH transport system substrate-binding protein
MIQKRLIEFVVGLFMLAGIVAVFMLAMQVSGLSKYSTHNAYKVFAIFDNVGDLKARAPVTIAGVHVGEVYNIVLDNKSFKAKVTLLIDKHQTTIPVDSSAQILTAGLIGGNYIELTPGYEAENLKEGGEIVETHPAIILEHLVGQLIYNLKGKDKDKSTK